MLEWINRLNKSIDYIEEHLTSEIEYGALAKNRLLFIISLSKDVRIHGKYIAF